MAGYSCKSYPLAALRIVGLAMLLLVGGRGRVVAQQVPVDERFGAVDAFRDPNAAVESRVGWERITFDWSQLEPGPETGLVNAGLEEVWFTDARSAGREIVGLLVNTPDWASEGRPNIGVPSGLYLPPNNTRNVWANFVRQVVETYARRGVNHWVIWDNPNIPSSVYGNGWEGSVQDYYQLLKVAYISAKSVNPDAQIHLAGYSLTYDAQWLARLMDVVADDPTAPDSNFYFDVATVHVYHEIEQVFMVVQNGFFVMQEHGIGKEIWIIETGAYPPDIALQEYPSVTPDQQASFIIQATALGLAAGVQRVGVSPFVDTQTDDGLLPGLLDPAGGPRPAYDGYRTVTDHFAGARAASRRQFELAEYVKIRQDDRITHVVWARTAAPAVVTIPASTESATLVDQAGNIRSISPEDGGYRVRVEAANCNGPGNSCPIGGPVMLVIEGNIDPFVDPTPSAPVEAGLAPTLSPNEITATPVPSPLPIASPSPEAAVVVPEVEPPAEEPAGQSTEPAQPPTIAPTPGPTPIPAPPTGFAAALPLVLVGLGTLVIGAGLGFWLRDRRGSEVLPETDVEILNSDE